jgi:hypothetical protein
MTKFDRAAMVSGLAETYLPDLLAKGLPEEQARRVATERAEDYVDARHGWTRLLVRPATKRQVKLAAKVAGVTMADWMAEAVREKVEREGGQDEQG